MLNEEEMQERTRAIAATRAVADWSEQHPELPMPIELKRSLTVFAGDRETALRLMDVLRGPFRKSEFQDYLQMERDDPLMGLIQIWVPKSLTCKRIVKTVHVEAVEEHDETRVEWECPDSILAALKGNTYAAH